MTVVGGKIVFGAASAGCGVTIGVTKLSGFTEFTSSSLQGLLFAI